METKLGKHGTGEQNMNPDGTYAPNDGATGETASLEDLLKEFGLSEKSVLSDLDILEEKANAKGGETITQSKVDALPPKHREVWNAYGSSSALDVDAFSKMTDQEVEKLAELVQRQVDLGLERDALLAEIDSPECRIEGYESSVEAWLKERYNITSFTVASKIHADMLRAFAGLHDLYDQKNTGEMVNIGVREAWDRFNETISATTYIDYYGLPISDWVFAFGLDRDDLTTITKLADDRAEMLRLYVKNNPDASDMAWAGFRTAKFLSEFLADRVIVPFDRRKEVEAKLNENKTATASTDSALAAYQDPNNPYSDARRKSAVSFGYNDANSVDGDWDDIVSFLKKHSKYTVNDLPEKERNWVIKYTGSFSNVNEPLRGKNYLGANDRAANEHIEHVEAMTNAINRNTLDVDMWVTRGVSNLHMGDNGSIGDVIKKFGLSALVGMEFRDPGFVSTGASKGSGFTDQEYMMNIYCPKGTKMLPVASISKYKEENEIIIQRGYTYRIRKVSEPSPTDTMVYLDVDVVLDSLNFDDLDADLKKSIMYI